MKAAKILKYSFKAKVWKYPGKSGWFFVSLSTALSKKIRLNHGFSEEGWGRLKASAQIGGARWQTSIWYDTKHKGYLLPIKSEIRKKEKIEADSSVNVQLQLEIDRFPVASLRKPFKKGPP